VRGKAKLFEELTAAYAQATGPESDYPQRALDAERQKKAIEAELELMVARLETAIRSYSRSAASDSDEGDTPPLLLTRPRCDPKEGSSRSVLY
jgi:hypothetical protein